MAASVYGDAEGHKAVSVEGNATGYYAVSGLGEAEGGLVAVTGTGEAICDLSLCLAASPTGDATGAVPVSATGDCRTTPADPYRSCQDVAPTEDAHGYYAAVSATGNAHGGVAAVTARGDATCDGSRCVAVSGTGQADCEGAEVCVSVHGTGPDALP